MSNEKLLTRSVAKVIPQDLAEKKLASGEKLRVYWGIDPTGSKMHIGHTIPMRKLQQFADAGHYAILVIGSFTAMLGDPSDKDAMRKPLTKEEVEKNFETYREQAAKILDFDKVEIRYNHEWLETLNYNDIVQHASCFTVQQMEERDMFERRMKAGKEVGLHEFLYPLMVGYDSAFLDVDCEIGGSDQEFNLLAGLRMQKWLGKPEKFILTTPLIDGTDGRLMSKTYDNCVYLEDKPEEMYGKLMSINDELIPVYMECCTDIPMEEVESIRVILNSSKDGKNDTSPKELKMHLAHEVVSMYHGADAADKAQEGFESVFKNKGVPDDIPEAKLKEGTLLIDVLVSHKLVTSKSEAKRLIEQGGVKLNDKEVTSADAIAEEGIVKVGKRKFLKLK